MPASMHAVAITAIAAIATHRPYSNLIAMIIKTDFDFSVSSFELSPGPRKKK